MTIATALIGTGGWAAFLRVRSQNRLDKSKSKESDASAAESLSRIVRTLSERLNAVESESRARLAQVELQLQSDIEAKEIRITRQDERIKRLESDVVIFKRLLSEWQAYARGLFDMLVALGQRPPKPPDTGPLK